MSRLLSPTEFNALLTLARHKKVNFAFGLGKQPDDHMLILHRKISGKPLFAALKRETDGIVKGTWGIMKTTPKKIVFRVEQVIPGLKMSLRRSLRHKNIGLRPVLFDTDGNEIRDCVDEIEDLTGTPRRPRKKKKKTATRKTAGAAKKKTRGGADPDRAARKRQLDNLIKSIKGVVKNAIAVDPERRMELARPLARAQSHLKSDELDEARTAILEIGRLLKS